ncbi:MAG: hypothetical protein KatS3mg028_1482 [Bacteroidia bacterium]|nr:MAG: hypothetical protein KatS3mg028_1482 [Bacteroidia bacterium]
MIRISVYILSFFLLFSCANKEVNICISNTSFTDQEIFIEVFIDEEKLVSQTFRADSITPNYDCFSFVLNKDKVALLVSTLNKDVVFKDTIDVENSQYVYIEYKYKVINDTAGAYEGFLSYERIANTDSVIIVPKKFQIKYSESRIDIE